MRMIKVGAGVVNQTALDWEGNRARLVAAIDEARKQKVQILCLPELAITGYGCEDAFFAPDVLERSAAMLKDLVQEAPEMLVAVGLPVVYQGSLYNAAALLAGGRVHGLVAKQTLAGDGIHYEPRWFKPWPAGAVRRLRLDDEEIPFGDLVFECDGIRIGFEICEDAWIAARPGSRLATRGMDIILNPSASHFAFDKQRIRERFVLEGSRAFHTTYVYTNLLGNEAGRIIYDGGPLIATGGQIIASGPRFPMVKQFVTWATVDIALTRMLRTRSVSARTMLEHDESDLVRVPGRLAPAEAAMCDPVSVKHYGKEEEFTLAMTLGLFDYLTKSWSRGVVVSLSGGADSAAVAVLCGLMIDRFEREMGPGAWPRHVSYLGFDEILTLEQVKRELIFCVYQATRHSSETTRQAAEAVANGIGARYAEWDVEDLVGRYRENVERSLERELTWEKDDVTLQNIQARVRSPGVWMLANALGALLLSTSNRSEAAVGYATMDGDTSGGLSPIAGIDKAFLRHWLRWLETEGGEHFPPMPFLSAVNAQQPTAELRPREATQTDEADLMPYPLLDAIERAAIRDKRPPADVLVEMRLRFPEYDEDSMKEWVRRFFQLWSRNQWKRERYAPSFHLDDKNLDPKTWCRFPILSGGFRSELRDME